ncbi:MAG: hypothetical protein JHC95_05985 [Solirubrobacteraceae bacterium]|nr:hypothetical protein [Solirubrobacteraceae bacterium]
MIVQFRWEPAGEPVEQGLVPYVDGSSLLELGEPGEYSGIRPWEFTRKGAIEDHYLGGAGSHLLAGPGDRTVLVVCACGDPGCGAVMARIEQTGDGIVWRDLIAMKAGEAGALRAGPYRFGRQQYRYALAEAVAARPR